MLIYRSLETNQGPKCRWYQNKVQSSHFVVTWRFEKKQEKANNMNCQRVAVQPASVGCLKYVKLPEPEVPLTENNCQRRGWGGCLGCVLI